MTKLLKTALKSMRDRQKERQTDTNTKEKERERDVYESLPAL